MISVSDQGLYRVLYVRQAAVSFEQFAEWWTEKTLDRGGRFLSWAQKTPVSVAGSGPRTVSLLRQGVQRQLQAKAAPGLVPLHSGHWKAFLVSPIPSSCPAAWIGPRPRQSNPEAGRCWPKATWVWATRPPHPWPTKAPAPGHRPRQSCPRGSVPRCSCCDSAPTPLPASPASSRSTASRCQNDPLSLKGGRESGVEEGEAAPQGARARAPAPALASQGARLPDALWLKSAPSCPICPASLAAFRLDGTELGAVRGARSLSSEPSAPQRAVCTLASRPSRSCPHRSGCGRGGCREPCRWGKSPGGSRCGSTAGGAAGSPSGGRSLWANRAAASPRSGPGARSGNQGSQLRACSPEMRKNRADPSPRRRRPPPPPPWRGARGRAGVEVRELPLPEAGVGDSPALAP